MFDTFRDFLSEFRSTISLENKFFSIRKSKPDSSQLPESDADIRRTLDLQRSDDLEAQHTLESQAHYYDVLSGYARRNAFSSAPFEFYESPNPDRAQEFSHLTDSRLPAPGIIGLPLRYHKTYSQPIEQTELANHTPHPYMTEILYGSFPQYALHVQALCRPAETKDSTFNDFNKPQTQYPSIPQSLSLRIINLICILMNALPFRPLHYVDTFFTKMPLSTGVSYFYRHSYELRTHAHFAHNSEYATKPTSKGYFLNSFTLWARLIVHRIKEHALPFSPDNLSPSEQLDRLRTFFLEHATTLFTRSQISKATGPYKLRPVYAVDTLFLLLENMITYPLHVLARSTQSCVLYSLETIRGGCARIDSLAQSFHSYLCIDWSSFDQRVPFIITDTFFTIFLPSLLIVSHGYVPTTEYSTYPGLTPDKLFYRLYNIIIFLRTWYFNMVFVTHDGFAFVRTLAGIASGMLNTQYLDSYCNLFLMIHALIHFGCSDAEILEIMFFVLGDDNVLLTNWPLLRLEKFLLFLESHSLTRFGMVLSRTKSLITSLRSRIEILGYQCNHGYPRRPIDKLVAQLVFPEHGFEPKYMSDRAIGLAYASAGCDPTFYDFCKMTYTRFLPFRDPSSHPRAHHFLPGFMRAFDDPEEHFTLSRFPTIYEISTRYSHWQGELPQDKKWSPSHFISAPSFHDPFMISMTDFMTLNDITFPDVPDLFTTYAPSQHVSN